MGSGRVGEVQKERVESTKTAGGEIAKLAMGLSMGFFQVFFLSRRQN